MKPYLLLLVLLFVAHSFAQTTEVISLDYPQLQPMLHQNSETVQVVNFWATWCAPCIKGQSHQMVANTSVNMYFDCDGNSINAKNGTCNDLGQHK